MEEKASTYLSFCVGATQSSQAIVCLFAPLSPSQTRRGRFFLPIDSAPVSIPTLASARFSHVRSHLGLPVAPRKLAVEHPQSSEAFLERVESPTRATLADGMAVSKSVDEQIADLEQEMQALNADQQADRDAIQQRLVTLRAHRGETQAESSAEEGQNQLTDAQTGATTVETMTELPAPQTVTRPGVGRTTVRCTLFDRCPCAGTEAEEAYTLDYYGAKTFSRYLQRLAPCDGSKDLETLKWLRLIHEAPSELRIALATEAATGSLLHFILKALDEDITWPALKLAIACEYINLDFSRRQRDTLQALLQ